MSAGCGAQQAQQAQQAQRSAGQQSTDTKHYPFWLGGVAASIAVCFTHPLDLVKLRMQNSPQKTTVFALLRDTLQKEGVRGLFAAYEEIKGYMLRQGTYGPVTIWQTIGAAGLAGVAGGIAGNPADVVLVRMTSDMYRPPDQQFRYTGALDGVVRIVREESVKTLFRGITPNVARAMLMNSSQLASYDFFKELLKSSGWFVQGGLPHYLCSSLLAGTVATTICSPADVIRARMMNARRNSNWLHNLGMSVRQEGSLFLFRGWLPSWMRLAPQTVILLTVLEELRAAVDYVRK
ncbi:Dic1p [Malassezia vespertilionis]|uniref:Dic1p n=1 Tax=Malassezia vespertilionis TaxID=2020962 RepID=A0A2N1J887_9BASI|nr:Dic1p [Malassezia vespertilionis]